MIGKTLNHFKVLSHLGKGGMGEVFVAEDSKLKRRVALKVLPEEVARDPVRLDRFQREAESIAALNHPNIVTIYSIEEADGVNFLTMELVDGETLIELIPSNGLDVETFVRFGASVAEALSAAHEKGIIHRDLKPGNIMVNREGRVKVLDFGLAKLMRDDSDPDSSRVETQTEAGIVLGTMPYMSPEQIQGKKLDQRSDIFSLGIIFYEMITGSRPFQGDTSADLISSIMRDTPHPVSDVKSGMPEHLERIIRRCLMKDPKDRYQTARDVYNELRDPSASSGPSSRSASASPSGEMWIAVLPFQHPAGDPEMESFSDGIVQDISAALSQFSYLSVISENSTLRLKGQSYDVRAASVQLGARYVIQGAIRKSGSLIRVNVQLIDARTGTNLWADTYNRDLKNSDIFTIQDEITDRVAGTLADNFGLLVRSMVASLEGKPDDQLSSNEFVFRFFGYWTKLTPEEHAKIRTTLERAVERIPRNAEIWGCLSLVYYHEFAFGFNELPNSLDRCLAAAQHAVELNRASQTAYEALTWAQFFRRDVGALPATVERAISLNPRNSHMLAVAGLVLVHTRNFDRGATVARRAMELNPHHAGWFHFSLIWDHYSRSEYDQSLEQAKRVNMPGFFWPPLVIASICGELGRTAEAASAVNELLTIDPEFAVHARRYIEPWHYASGFMDSLIEGLRKAGLQIPEKVIDSGPSTPPAPTSPSGEMWIAVLPFQHPAADPEMESFSDGLVEDISAALSQFSYLSVISGNSTLRLKGQPHDLRTVSTQLGARYVLQGGIRKSGSLIRVNVQLIDAHGGANLWAETYNRDLQNSDIFIVQDEITDRVAATVADSYGVLVRSMVATIEAKPEDQLSPTEYVLRFFGYYSRLTPQEHAKIRTTLEKAVEKIPGNADIWGCLSIVYYNEYLFHFNELPNSLDRCLAAAQHAVELNRASQIAYEALSWAHFFRHDKAALHAAMDRATSLNPRNSNTLAQVGGMLTHTGEFERGAKMVRRAIELNPHHAGWFHFPLIWDHFSRNEYEQVLERAKQVNMPGFFWTPLVIAAACGQLGRKSEGTAALTELLVIDPEFATHARDYIEPLLSSSGLVDLLLEGLQKAGVGHSTDRRKQSAVQHTTSSAPSIAVLPFTNMSADEENEYFCDGLAEELLNALSKLNELRVSARTSAFSFKRKNANISEIGEKLGVKHVLEGSVRKSGNRMRITVQLVNVSDGFHIWSERYDRELKDIFEVQDEITLSVIDALKLKLFGGEKEAVLKRYTDDAEVHELFLKGRYHAYKYTAEGWKQAIEFFEKAIEKQPDYAPAYAGIASCWGCLWFFGIIAADPAVSNCKSATRRALAIDANLAEAHLPQALMNFLYDWEWEQAEQSFKQAVVRNPNNAEALSYYALFLAFEGRIDEAITTGKRSLEIDPLAPLINMNVGWTFFSSGLSDEALDQAGKMIEIEPDFFGAYWLKGAIYLSEGEYGKAVEELKKAVSLGGHRIVLADLGSAYGLAGQEKEAAAILEQLLEMHRQEYVPAICLARIYSRIGENDKAIEWLEKAFEQRNGEMVFLQGEIEGAADSDSLKSLGSNAKVIELLQKMNLP